MPYGASQVALVIKIHLPVQEIQCGGPAPAESRGSLQMSGTGKEKQASLG